jgi:uncharacterized protein (TIGR02594 family)
MSDFKVRADSLHVRRTPTVADNVVGFLHKGDVVQRLGTSKNEQFLKVRHGDLTGWASKKWLTRITPKAQRYQVIATHLNVRRQPKVVRGNVKGTLDHGDVVTSDGSTGDGKWLHVKKGSLTGYASARYLRSVKRGGPAPAPAPGGAPEWYKKARKELNDDVARVAGAGDNPRVVQYLKSTNLGKPANRNDETPWCSAFVNWCVEQSGEDGTNSASARSWMGWGRKLKKPTKGCVVVLWRGSKHGTQGHVGFYVRSVGRGSFVLLAGNQGDRVSTLTFSKDRVLGYRTL